MEEFPRDIWQKSRTLPSSEVGGHGIGRWELWVNHPGAPIKCYVPLARFEHPPDPHPPGKLPPSESKREFKHLLCASNCVAVILQRTDDWLHFTDEENGGSEQGEWLPAQGPMLLSGSSI